MTEASSASKTANEQSMDMSTQTTSAANGAPSSNNRPLSAKFRQFAGRARLVANYLIGRQALDPGVTIFDDDTWYVSYPRSGNTYWRFLTANLISKGKPVDWTNIERYAPDIYVTRDSILRELPRPRYLKSHEPFKPAYRRVVLIIRDPRDVAVSCFHSAKRWYMIAEDMQIDEFIPDWIAGRIYSYGTWNEFNGSWLGARRGTPNFSIFRYEDMVNDPATHLARLAEQMKLSVSAADIERAIENSRPEHLRNLERAQRNKHKALREARNTSPYVRAATSGQWPTALSPESIRAIESACGPLMREFGYL
jgi:hypothetical protein